MHPHGSEFLNRSNTVIHIQKKQEHISKHTGISIGNSITNQTQIGKGYAGLYKVLFENGLQMLSP